MHLRFASLTIVAALSVAAVAAGPAAAAPLPTLGAAEGVTAKTVAKGIEVRFAGVAAQAAARYVGRTLQVQCETQQGTGPIFADADLGGSGNDVPLQRDADGTLVLRTRLSGGVWDTCEVGRRSMPRVTGRQGPFRVLAGMMRPPLARVALTAGGATWIDEVAQAIALDAAATEASAVRRGGVLTAAEAEAAGLVVLPGEGASPPPGRVGYWTDGAQTVEFVALSSVGRRLVVEAVGATTTRTNIGRLTNATAAARGTPVFELDIGDADTDATPSPLRGGGRIAEPAPLLPAAVHGRRLAVRFAGAKARRTLRRLAGRRVSVLCGPGDLSNRSVTDAKALVALFQRVTVRVPRRGTVLRATLRPGQDADACSVTDDGNPVAVMVPTAKGRVLLSDLVALGRIYDAIPLVPEGAASYPPAASLAAQRPKRLVAMSAPDDALKAGGRAGVWTDGTRAVIAARSASGHRFALGDEGDGMLSDNTTWLLLASMLLG